MPVFGGSDDRGKRTAAEREAARRERERRRAERAGGSESAGGDGPAGAARRADGERLPQETRQGSEPSLREGLGPRPGQGLEEQAADGELPVGLAVDEQEHGPMGEEASAGDADQDALGGDAGGDALGGDAGGDALGGDAGGDVLGGGGGEEPSAPAAPGGHPAGAAGSGSYAAGAMGRRGERRGGQPGEYAPPGIGRLRRAQDGRDAPGSTQKRAGGSRGAQPGRRRQSAAQQRPGLRGGGSRPGAARGPRTLAARIGALAALVFIAVVVWLLVSIFQPFQGSGHGRVVVQIPKGAGASRIGSILAKDGVVSSGFFFDVRAFLDGKGSEFHPGRYVLKRGMSYSSAMAALTGAVPHVAVVKVVIPEGETRRQIAAIAREDGLKGDYLRVSRRASGFDPVHYGAPASTPNLEGFLFPATYEVDVHGNVSSLVTKQLEAFNERFDAQYVQQARKMHITPYQLLIVASMIEREAKLPKDRPLIAAVIYNRLRLGMPLGIDATIRFALNNYSKPLTEAQLHVNSPYNTRLHKGLPPTPISNPGVESLEAAAKPAKAGYLYYVNGTDGCGDLVFSNSFAEFERNSAAYQEALNANGGNEPKCKKG